jgi:predicted NAD/FAD-dependent oxidoreductase
MQATADQGVDLAIIGAGLSGCALVAALRARGFGGSILVLEAGRGAGGRAATRRRRDDPLWRLDHGSPTLSFSQQPQAALAALLKSLLAQGVLVPDRGEVVGLDLGSGAVQLVAPSEHPLLCGPRWRGMPTMAAVAEALLAAGGGATTTRFGGRIRNLEHGPKGWWLDRTIRARTLVLSGTLLAHPRSLAMLDWPEVPLRVALPEGEDPCLDQALLAIAAMQASVRWNLMLELPAQASAQASAKAVAVPRQIWLTPQAQQHFGVERLVLQRQRDGRLGLVVHGLDGGAAITPAKQPELLRQQEQRLRALLPQLLGPWPDLQASLVQAQVLGVMRWGAAQPVAPGLAPQLQWCARSRVGFCGDWIAGPGFAMAEGAIQSALDLADQLLLSC